MLNTIDVSKNNHYIANVLIKIVLYIFISGIFILIFFHVKGSLIAIMDGNFKIWQILLIYFQLMVEIMVFFETILILFYIIKIISIDTQSVENGELTAYPDIDVYIPIRRVDINILEKTFLGLKQQDYPGNIHIFVADDTPEKELSIKYRELCDKYSFTYIYDPSNTRYKAGMLNIVLPKGKSKYIAFFDYDQIPTPGIIKKFVNVLVSNPNVPFVQAKKSFIGLNNRTKVWSALLYLQFFEVYERSKDEIGTVMFAGSTAMFRRDAIESVGGIPETTFTEDNNLSIKLLLNGKHGKFLNIVGSIGTVPPNFRSQISQLWRWSHGGTHTLKVNFTSLIKSKKLNWSQKIDIISTLCITPLIAIVYLYTITFPILFISGVDSPRFMLYGISSIIFAPVALSIIYSLFAFVAIYLGKIDGEKEYRYSDLPSFFVIALSGNLLILYSGILGILGIWGPQSPKGKWTRSVPILKIAVFSFIIGIICIYYSIIWLISGFTGAILPLIIAITLLPTLPIVLIYRNK